jgi:2-methylfumaryl-CoA hydratase
MFLLPQHVTDKEMRMRRKACWGNFFEDFRLGQVIRHGTPRTVTDGDSAVYAALTGSRFALHAANTVARKAGFRERPLDDLLVFNIALGQIARDVFHNVEESPEFSNVHFFAPVYRNDTLHSESVVIGIRDEVESRRGTICVRSTCCDHHGSAVLGWVSAAVLRKRKPGVARADCFIPETPFSNPPSLPAARLDSREALEDWCGATGSDRLWEDYKAGMRIDHPCGTTIEEADHMSASRLFQNSLKAHPDAFAMRGSDAGQREVHGAHVLSVCRALACDGLENVAGIYTISQCKTLAPTLAGDTLYAFTEVKEKTRLPGRQDIGLLRLRLVGLKNCHPSEIETAGHGGLGESHRSAVVLDLDYTVVVPRRQAARIRAKETEFAR